MDRCDASYYRRKVPSKHREASVVLVAYLTRIGESSSDFDLKDEIENTA